MIIFGGENQLRNFGALDIIRIPPSVRILIH